MGLSVSGYLQALARKVNNFLCQLFQAYNFHHTCQLKRKFEALINGLIYENEADFRNKLNYVEQKDIMNSDY